MKLRVLWVIPAERRFGSGDILTSGELKAFGVDPAHLLEAGEAEVVEDAPASPAPAKAKRKK